MLPLGHLVVALLPVTLYTLVRKRRLPTGTVVVLLVLATQLPDLIDKPLAWTFHVLPSGRMFAHSLVVSLPVLAGVTVLAHRRGEGRLGLLFSAAYLSHLAGDFYPILYRGTDYYFFPNLFWPLLAANPDRAPSFAAHGPESVLSLFVWVTVFGCVTCYGIVSMYRRRRPAAPV
ncbi:metal-dependent hydrolase [Haloarcula salina]|uniref:metal-dependent hydrolase n=1 Tax=Haloarcula salina TaxID=1429914 RepID=UPI003C702A5B